MKNKFSSTGSFMFQSPFCGQKSVPKREHSEFAVSETEPDRVSPSSVNDNALFWMLNFSCHSPAFHLIG